MIKSLGNRTFRLGDRQLDLELWQKLYYKCQKEYLRKRLLAIKYLYEGKKGFDKLTIILDQDSTDKKKMKSQLKFYLINAQISDKIVVDFISRADL
jgi:hypothetical protein